MTFNIVANYQRKIIMNYLIFAFRSRAQSMKYYNELKKTGVNCALINTPREISVGCGLSVKTLEDGAEVTATVRNEGNNTGSETLQVYVKDLESPLAVRNHSLAAFRCVTLNAGEERTITLHLSRRAFEEVNEEGERVLESRRFRGVGTCSG